ncbi:uncharacterized protein LOC124172645 isoform X2 [Ischnura elegans]|uniref:uncharacterized protein LOC124172645 isoform X2 n=1 Tax=Ischnura elegans TaxID=197161 RepID=UPI001ED876CD|nr:uncharacterized protein LOC124172645 isoform X2 [Ischnura elegans]XP_046408050.1 uncharacterized protein LOC124172645 isoform X2 [Ischnura elegans]
MGDCDIRGMCRLCLCKCDNLVEIFVLGECHGYYAAEVIQDLLQIEVSLVDGFPQCVCAECLDKLTDFKVFKDKCLKSRSTFQQMLQRKIEQAEQKDLQDVQVDVLPMVCSIKEEPQESEIVEIPVEPEVSINEEPNECANDQVLGNQLPRKKKKPGTYMYKSKKRKRIFHGYRNKAPEKSDPKDAADLGPQETLQTVKTSEKPDAQIAHEMLEESTPLPILASLPMPDCSPSEDEIVVCANDQVLEKQIHRKKKKPGTYMYKSKKRKHIFYRKKALVTSDPKDAADLGLEETLQTVKTSEKPDAQIAHEMLEESTPLPILPSLPMPDCSPSEDEIVSQYTPPT